MFLAKSDRLSFFTYTRTGYTESLFKVDKLNWIPLYSSVSLSFVGPLYGTLHYRLFESYSKYVYSQEPAFHLAILCLLLKVAYNSNLQIAWFATLLSFHYTAQCTESFSTQQCVIFVKHTCLFWPYNFVLCLNGCMQLFLWRNMRNGDHV